MWIFGVLIFMAVYRRSLIVVLLKLYIDLCVLDRRSIINYICISANGKSTGTEVSIVVVR